MTDVFVETPAEPTDNRLSVWAAIFLGLAATLTAFSAYQAALTDGEALAGYTESTSALTEANRLYGVANQVQVGDRQLFTEYATTVQDPQAPAEASEYLKTLMRPELVEALDWWLATDEALTPFDDLPGNPYAVAELAQADERSADAAEAFAAASAADDTGDEFELSTVLFALTLFFGGIATLFRKYRVTVALLTVSAVALVAGSVQLGIALG